MTKPKIYVASLFRRLLSIPLGALIAGALLSIPLAGALSESGAPFKAGLVPILPVLVIGFCFAGIVALLAIVVTAMPLWLLFERAGRANGWTASLLGLILQPTLALVLVVCDEMRIAARVNEPFRWSVITDPIVAPVSLLLAGVGCVTALAMWRYAYRLAQAAAEIAFD